MASFHPTEWSKAVKSSVAGITSIAVIIGFYLSVEAWADDKITESERRQIEERAEEQAINDINHSKIIQSARIESAQTNISITELTLAILEDEMAEREEDGKEPTERQDRAMDRLLRLLETYETEQTDATSKLTTITTTTTTTTTQSRAEPQ